VRILLVHNPTAGGGQEADGLIALLEDAGHDVRYSSSKDDWKRLLQDPGDLVVAGGGDGTVADVALAAAERGFRFAPLPIGTANNIGKSLEIVGDARDVVESWAAAPARPFDLGRVELGGDRTRFVESVGGGIFGALIARRAEVEADAKLLGRETDRALHMLSDLLHEATPRGWRISADGTDASGEYLAVEVLNVRFVGPNVPLAPNADPSDGMLDLVCISVADREALSDYLEMRLRLAGGALPELAPIRAASVRLTAPAGERLHLDDRPWPSAVALREPLPLEVRCLPGAATVVAGRPAD
jgi:diacylglycerol kinase family enzyme